MKIEGEIWWKIDFDRMNNKELYLLELVECLFLNEGSRPLLLGDLKGKLDMRLNIPVINRKSEAADTL